MCQSGAKDHEHLKNTGLHSATELQSGTFNSPWKQMLFLHLCFVTDLTGKI